MQLKDVAQLLKLRVLQEINMQTLLFEEHEKMKDDFKKKSEEIGSSICLGSSREQWLGGHQRQPEPLHPRRGWLVSHAGTPPRLGISGARTVSVRTAKSKYRNA